MVGSSVMETKTFKKDFHLLLQTCYSNIPPSVFRPLVLPWLLVKAFVSQNLTQVSTPWPYCKHELFSFCQLLFYPSVFFLIYCIRNMLIQQSFFITVEPPLFKTATSPQRPPLYNSFFLVDSPYIHSCFNLSTMATFFCPQGGHCRGVQLYVKLSHYKFK